MTTADDALKRHLQSYIVDGVVFIVGSGLSVAEGIPGMGGLAQHLLENVERELVDPNAVAWRDIRDALAAGKPLESVLLEHTPTENVELAIRRSTAKFIRAAEVPVLQEVISSRRVLRFTQLVAKLPRHNKAIPVITTNYDRLLEVGVEAGGFGADTMFAGYFQARFSKKESRMSFARSISQPARRPARISYVPRFVVLKPHGSLDWFLLGNEPVRTPVDINEAPLIITPGQNKYRAGYEHPFDEHRECANHHIDHAAAFVIIGYGFNDDHLQTHLATRIAEGTPTLILTRTLSESAIALTMRHKTITALARGDDDGLLVFRDATTKQLSTAPLWDLGVFTKEVL